MLKKFKAATLLLVIGLIAQAAFSQSQAVEGQKQTPATQLAGPGGAPAALQNGQLQNVQTHDVPKEIYDASHHLQVARADLEQAGGEWGHHKANAMNRIDEALRELQLAIDYAKSH